MALINFFSAILAHVLIGCGIFVFLATLIPGGWGWIPNAAPYKLAAQILSVIAIGLGGYVEGGMTANVKWETERKVLQAKIKDAGVAGKKANATVGAKLADKKKDNQEQVKTVIQYIDREVIKYDQTCKIGDEVILAHNAAAKNEISLLTEPILQVPVTILAPRKSK